MPIHVYVNCVYACILYQCVCMCVCVFISTCIFVCVPGRGGRNNEVSHADVAAVFVWDRVPTKVCVCACE